MKITTLLIYLSPLLIYSQNYTSYFTGNASDVVTSPEGGICLMGGATEHDEAMKWFLQRANGGDILVLRASGSNGYNDYMYSQLGINVNSVETIVCNNASASADPYIHQKIANAEAIWFAGGDQWNYISYWRNTAVDSLINVGLSERNIVIGGTSAGMAIQGGYYFSAENGTVTSTNALNNPYNTSVTPDGEPFLNNSILENVITDTHYDNPDRKGRHVTFLARILTDEGIAAKGIACDEYTAVCIDENGLASVYGNFPTYDDNAYFIQPNCALADFTPENCSAGNKLEWNRSGVALQVYKVKGTNDGTNTIDLTNWSTVYGGIWQNWYVDDGVLYESGIFAPSCFLGQSINHLEYKVYPNPTQDYLTIAGVNFENVEFTILDIAGKEMESTISITSDGIDLRAVSPGVYFLIVIMNDSKSIFRIEKI